jgi:hypothetical protein
VNQYTELPQLAAIYLEDSWVLDVVARPSLVRFDLDLVLTPEHPEHSPIRPGEQHCYRRGRIEFTGVRRVLWTEQGAQPATDASGTTDYGNIDSFLYDEIGYHLEGSWGRMELQADDVRVSLGEDDEAGHAPVQADGQDSGSASSPGPMAGR